MAGVDVGKHDKRSLNRDINMIPFIDLLMVTVAFLLITAVWISFSRVEVDAQVPGPPDGEIHPERVERVLHVYVHDNDFTLTWKQGATVLREALLERRPVVVDDGVRYPDLAERVAREWRLQGAHQDASDGAADRCVLHTDDRMPFVEMVGVMDAIHQAKRSWSTPRGTLEVAAFRVALASR